MQSEANLASVWVGACTQNIETELFCAHLRHNWEMKFLHDPVALWFRNTLPVCVLYTFNRQLFSPARMPEYGSGQLLIHYHSNVLECWCIFHTACQQSASKWMLIRQP